MSVQNAVALHGQCRWSHSVQNGVALHIEALGPAVRMTDKIAMQIVDSEYLFALLGS
jgi:hypothetical protein